LKVAFFALVTLAVLVWHYMTSYQGPVTEAAATDASLSFLL
jgi:hypothetical protein